MKFLTTSQEVLETLEADIKAVGRWIPPVASDKLKELQLLHKAKQTHCDKIKLKGECLDFPGFIRNMSEFKNDFKSQKAVMDEQMQTAKLWTGKERVRSLLESKDRRKKDRRKKDRKKKDRKKKDRRKK